MKKFVFWGLTQQNRHIAFNEDLSFYARGETFWKAVKNLCDAAPDPLPSSTTEETDMGRRLRMFQETGVNKVEVFVEAEGDRYSVRCTNSRSVLTARDEAQALILYVDRRAETAHVNTGGE